MENHVIEMGTTYPFGCLSNEQSPSKPPLVAKYLHFVNQQQKSAIHDILEFLKNIQHPNIVTLLNIQQTVDHVTLLYEYVPLKLEKWILDVNQSALETLEQQLKDMAQYLIRGSIKFSFNPDGVGLDQNMSAKFFLNEFSVDLQNFEENYSRVEQQISIFFKELKDEWNNQKQKQENLLSVKNEVPRARSDTGDCRTPIFDSIATNESLSNIEENAFLNRSLTYIEDKYKKQGSNNNKLSQQVANSMKKSLEVLMKFRKIGEK